MSIQLQPQKNFAIVRQLPDPSDSNTYYVRAVIRNAETDALIDTINLTDKGERRFIGIWRAIVDKSGQGTLVSIRTAVYTDSGYTTPSDTYSQEIETYLILERFNPNEIVRALGPAIGGDDVDYKRIAKIVNYVFEKRLEKVFALLDKINAKKGEGKEIILEIKAALNLATGEIIEAMPAETKETDIAPILERLDKMDILPELRDRIKNVRETVENKKIDFAPVIEAMNKLESSKQPTKDHIKEMTKVFDDFSKAVKTTTPELSKMLEGLSGKLKDALIPSMFFQKPEETKRPDHKSRAREILGITDGKQ